MATIMPGHQLYKGAGVNIILVRGDVLEQLGVNEGVRMRLCVRLRVGVCMIGYLDVRVFWGGGSVYVILCVCVCTCRHNCLHVGG